MLELVWKDGKLGTCEWCQKEKVVRGAYVGDRYMNKVCRKCWKAQYDRELKSWGFEITISVGKKP